MRAWGIGALLLFAIFAASCSSNSTVVAVHVTTTVSGASSTSVTLLVNTSAQFVANVTGASATTAFWQICKPTNPPSTTVAPTDCTQGVGPTQCTIPKVSSPLTGFGTITPNGLYTAPPGPPQPDSFLVVATSCVKPTVFGTFTVIVDSGVRVKITPSSATLGTGEQFQFIITVTGTNNQAVSLSLCQTGNGGGLTCGIAGAGSISPSGLYQAPGNPVSFTLQAISSADQNQSATATVSVGADVAPTVTAIDPKTAAQGSAQQDVYVTGTNFLSTSNVLVGGVQLPTSNVVVLSATALRATIPAAQLAQAGTLQVAVQDQEGNPPGTINLNVVTVRPALVGSAPDSVPQNPASSPNVILNGGFFAPPSLVNGDVVGTTATFNGQSVSATVTSSRQVTLAIPTGSLATPGLYPIVVQNSGVVLGNPVSFVAGSNLGVTPTSGSLPTSAVTSVGVGANPSAVAIDEADGIAVVANKSDGTVSLVSLPGDSVINTPTGTSIPVGNQPTAVAVDDQLTDPIALVVNSGDQTVSTIDLTTRTVVGSALSVSIGPMNTSPIPFAVGINSLTHRAIVVYQSTNQATILDLSTGTPTVVQQVAGVLNSLGTGASPAVAIDPRLNWAVVTPGGTGAVSLVDLGFNPSAGQPSGRAPQVVGSIAVTTTVQGIGINTETHEAFLSDPQLGALITFSLLDYTVNPVFTGGTAFNQQGFGATAASALENVGIAVGSSSSAVIVDLENNVVLQTVNGLGSSPNSQAVAVDPVTNQAVVVNQGGSSVSIVSLGAALKALQIVEASPEVIFGGAGAADAQLKIIGSGFIGGNSQVLLDGTALPNADVTVASSREIIATVPGAMLSVPRRYTVQVENAGAQVSNVTDLAVVQAVPVGKAPVGVAVDTDRDLAVVTNSTDGTVSLVALTSQTPVGPLQMPAGSVGTVGGPLTVGTTPTGVAVLPRAGLALVANTGSNDASVVDVTQTQVPASVTLCGASCSSPTGVAINQDTESGAITNANPGEPTSTGTVSFVGLSSTTPSSSTSPDIDHNPVAVAIDPNPLFPYAAVAIDSSSSGVDFLDTTKAGAIVGRAANLQNPTGIVFDPVNQIFLAANSLVNEVVLVDPATFLETPVRVGIGPTSLDYNYQASTLVTVNSVSHTMSVLSYVCPPSAGAPACLGPKVRTVIGLGGTQAAAPVFGPNAIAVDPILNLAVLVDEDNNQVLLIPLPH